MELSNLPKGQKKAKKTTCEKQDITEVSEQTDKKASYDKGTDISSHKHKKSEIEDLKESVQDMEHGEGNQDDNIPSPSAGKGSHKLKKLKEDKGLKSKMDMSKSNQKKIITKPKP